jgi:hypothetical protein
MATEKKPLSISLLRTDFSKSVAGFTIALIVGALIPRTIQFLVRRVLVKSIREFLILALAGWLTDKLARTIVSSKSSEGSLTK